MDDCNLEKLSISPGSLTPPFQQDKLEYACVVGSEVNKITLSMFARDANASYTIIGEGVDSKSVTLQEGHTSLVSIEVVADDGTTKKTYTLSLKRLSPSDACLSSLSVVGGFPLVPAFSADVTTYECYVPASCQLVELAATAPDSKTTIGLSAGPLAPVPLNLGLTPIQVVSTAPDGISKLTYNLSLYRQELPVIISTVALQSASLPRCSFCLSLVHTPHKTSSTGSCFLFCFECIKLLTRTNKENPIDGTPLEGDWLKHCLDVEQKLTSIKVGPIPPLTQPVSLSALADSWIGKVRVDKEDQVETCKSCSKKIPMLDMGIHESLLCSTKFPPGKLEHKIETQAWEKQLCTYLTDSDTCELISEAEQQERLYLQALPRAFNDSFKFPQGASPLDTLQHAATLYAGAVKTKPKGWEGHLGLGRVMEERFYARDIFGLKVSKSAKSDESEDGVEEGEDEGAGAVKAAVESGKQEEFEAICRQKGVGPEAPLALQLKAVEQEFQSLKEAGNQSQAEYVQSLYAWRSKQSVGKGGSKVGLSQEGPLGRARIKYTDAVSLAPGEHGARFRLGRLLLEVGESAAAIIHLQTALSIKPTHHETRLCLGIAWLRAGPPDLKREAVRLVREEIQRVLLSDAEHKCSSPLPLPLAPPTLHADVFPSWHTSTTLVRACLDLAACTVESASAAVGEQQGANSETYLLWAAHLAARAMQRILSRKETYTRMMWAVIETHSTLLTSMINSSSSGAVSAAVFDKCQQLAGLLSVCCLEASSTLAEMKLKTSQQAAVLRPCSSQVLHLLGDAQLAMSDSEPNRQQLLLSQAELSFRAAIDCIGKPSGEQQPPVSLEKQEWWQLRKQQLEAARQAEKAAQPAGKTTLTGKVVSKAHPGRGATVIAPGKPQQASATRPGVKPTAKTAPIAVKPGSVAPSKPAPAQAKGLPAPGRAGVKQPGVKAGPGPPAGGSKNVATLGQLKSGGTETQAAKVSSASVPPQPEESKQEKEKATEIEAGGIRRNQSASLNNAKTYHAFLGLARVLSRQNNPNTLQEAKSLYSEVISIAPGLHDAYIELADMLLEQSPLEAVDVYIKYPFPDSPTFDDAFLYGEIVRLLMREGQYDDSRLVPNMIHLGKIMGLSVLEKYVKILEDKFKTKAVMQVYAGVNGKEIDDPGLVQFFKFRAWM